MKKKMFTLFIMVIMLLVLIIPQTALASTGVTVDKSSVLPGEKVSISGTAGTGDNVVIKITDEAGNIVFFDAAKADAGGKYSASFVVPSDMAAGKLTVTAGSGNDIATATITVKEAPKPTVKPTSTPDPGGTAQPTASLMP